MKHYLHAALALCASAFVHAAHADQQFAYTESFTNVNDPLSTFVLSGTFSQSSTGVLTSLTSNVLANGTFSTHFNLDLIAARRIIQLPDVNEHGMPMELNGYFIGPAGNRNTITSCGQIFLDGVGCANWQSVDASIRSQGLTNTRTLGTGIGGTFLSSDNFIQTGALQISAVPEPSTVLMLAAGLGMVLVARRRRQEA